MDELVAAATAIDADPEVGADRDHRIRQAHSLPARTSRRWPPRATWTCTSPTGSAAGSDFTRLRIPVVAAVSGFALGGGCELAMMCDFIIAGGHREVRPAGDQARRDCPGIGGSQRLTRAVGKAKAMDLMLTGRIMDAEEAERAGLVSRVVPAADVVEEAMKAAEMIASKSLPVAMVAKEAVNAAFETGLAQGVRFERRIFHSLFATDDQKEGMPAFTEKRQPEFKHR